MKLIELDALVAEIEKKITYYENAFNNPSFASDEASLIAKGKYRKLLDIRQFIKSLEVKEEDFEKELDKEWDKCEPIDEGMGLEIASIEHEQFDNIAKHFFELGLKAKDK